MGFHTSSARALDEVARRAVDDHVIEIELDRLDDLFEEPSIDPFDERSRPLRAGIEELGATLTTLRRLPDDLTVRIGLPPEALAERPAAEVEAAVHRRAVLLASASWRDSMAVRSMGRRQTPIGLVIGIVAGVTAFGLVYLAKEADSSLALAALVVLAAIALDVAWVIGWCVIEAAMIDWRLDARATDAYEVLARARIELVPANASPAPVRGS